VPHLLSLAASTDRLNVFTLHAELEGMGKRALFGELLAALRQSGVTVVSLEAEARACLARSREIPVCELVAGPIDGRSGTLARPRPAPGLRPVELVEQAEADRLQAQVRQPHDQVGPPPGGRPAS